MLVKNIGHVLKPLCVGISLPSMHNQSFQLIQLVICILMLMGLQFFKLLQPIFFTL